jgi:hypothetical protein
MQNPGGVFTQQRRRNDFRGSDVDTERLPTTARQRLRADMRGATSRHSGFAPEAFTTFAHFLISERM